MSKIFLFVLCVDESGLRSVLVTEKKKENKTNDHLIIEKKCVQSIRLIYYTHELSFNVVSSRPHTCHINIDPSAEPAAIRVPS